MASGLCSSHEPHTYSLSQNESTMSKLLSQDDAVEVVKELLSVQTKSKELGHLLGLPRERVDAILHSYRDPQKQLFYIIEEFLKQIEPRPTWGLILEALRSTLLKEYRLAMDIESKLLNTRSGLHLTRRSLSADSIMNGGLQEVFHMLDKTRAIELVQALNTPPRNEDLEAVLRDIVLDFQSLMKENEKEITYYRQQVKEMEKELQRKEEAQLSMHQGNQHSEITFLPKKASFHNFTKQSWKWIVNKGFCNINFLKKVSMVFSVFLLLCLILIFILLNSNPYTCDEVGLTTDDERLAELKEAGMIQQEMLAVQKSNTSKETKKQSPPYMSHISGPGIVAATASYPTHVLVQLTPCPLPVELTAILELPTGTSPPNMSHTYLPVAMISSSRYEITYITYVRGKHKLHIKVNDLELDGSPFTITVYPDPTKLCHPVRTVEELEEPSSIYVESSNTFFVSESHGDKISIVKEDIRHKFGQDIIAPSYVVGDEDGYFYVTKEHEVLKINSKGDIINNSTDNIRNSSDMFSHPRGLTIYKKMLYICDSHNDRIQVLDLNLNFIKTIGSNGSEDLHFGGPLDVKFDAVGNMFVAERDNKRIQVIDRKEKFVKTFGQEGVMPLKAPTSLYIADNHVYIADWRGHHVVVYNTTGGFVASFGRRGKEIGEFRYSYCVTSCADGFIYVCDWDNERVQIF